jgi:D-serine deaminase-like pyridoxal phosphate-dependent protein
VIYVPAGNEIGRSITRSVVGSPVNKLNVPHRGTQRRRGKPEALCVFLSLRVIYCLVMGTINSVSHICRVDGERLRRLKEKQLDHTTKGLPFGIEISAAQAVEQNWNVLHGDMPLPLLLLKESALGHNLQEMAQWCNENRLLLAPHGKTTMCPQIFARQIEHGAWAMTVANISQAHVCANFGITRLIIANQVIGESNLRSLAGLMNTQPEMETYCLVDSVPGIRQLAQGLERFGAQQPINVLLEWGRWRAGVRSLDEGLEVRDEAARHPRFIRLCGVEAFEGLAHSPDGSDEEARQVDEFLEGLKILGESISELWPRESPPILSMGGSAFLDRVLLLARKSGGAFRVVVRSGCYITHDHIQYQQKQEEWLARSGELLRLPRFIPAIEMWSYVQSVPGKDLAILSFGKRDCPFDLHLPTPLLTLSQGELLEDARPLNAAKIKNLNDQHAYFSPGKGEEVQVGDLVCCGISHPCTAFDKWRVIPVVSDNYQVVDLYHTFF